MLGLANHDLADRFARSRDRFAGDHWEPGPHGVPILNDVSGWLVGKIQMRVSFENNAVVIVEVIGGEAGPDSLPLLYHSGGYGQLNPIEYQI